jgi:hypothetical protein
MSPSGVPIYTVSINTMQDSERVSKRARQAKKRQSKAQRDEAGPAKEVSAIDALM